MRERNRFSVSYSCVCVGGNPHTPILPDSVPIETARMMFPDDTNSMGNVHGGTILKLMEQAGSIVSTRHCNNKQRNPNGPPLVTALARMNQTDFYQPMYVGEIAHVKAAVTFTSRRSIEVTVDVWAENALTGVKRHTNSARLWYIAVPANVPQYSKVLHPQEVPQLTHPSEEEAAAGEKRYREQKQARELEDHMFGTEELSQSSTDTPATLGTVAASETTLMTSVVPSDCLQTGHMTGGALMKIMDTAAGICSVKHCRSLAVTVCMDAVNFHTPILVGELVTTRARVVFTSKRSLVVEVVCEAEGLRTNCSRVTNTAYFTFVSLNKHMSAIDVPPLKISNEVEEKKFSYLKQLYEKKKRQRQETKRKS